MARISGVVNSVRWREASRTPIAPAGVDLLLTGLHLEVSVANIEEHYDIR